nr:hypothetical protein [Mycobacterium lepromatosis]
MRCWPLSTLNPTRAAEWWPLITAPVLNDTSQVLFALHPRLGR